MLRTTEREETARAFERVHLVALPDGTQVSLGDVAQVKTGFRDTDKAAFYGDSPAVRLDVFRVGNQTPLDVSQAVNEFVERERARLPDGVGVATWDDISKIYDARMGLLLKNGYIGIALVLLVLGLFLEPTLAFWVTLGIPISFLGALILLPSLEVTINLISLFAFIITLGLVVDDAIVVGESSYRQRQEGAALATAAIEGAHEVARPVLYSIMTTCIAFTPMLFVGVAGQFFRNIPLVVILVLAASLVESLLVLPAHLSEPMPRVLRFVLTPFLWTMSKLRSDKVSTWLDGFVERRYVPMVRRAVTWRYATFAAGLALLALSAGLVFGGHIKTAFLPSIEDDQVRATIRMPVGSSFQRTREMQEHFVRAARAVKVEHEGEPITGIYAQNGVLLQLDSSSAAPPDTGPHVATVVVDLVPADERTFSSSEFSEKWRAAVGEVPQVDRVTYQYTTGATAGAPINVRLTHENEETLEAAAGELARALRKYHGVVDVDRGFTRGKPRLDFRLTPEGESAGLTAASLASEVRGAFYGAETQRFQRGRNEYRVYVSLPEDERSSVHDVEQMVLRTPRNGEIPLSEAAEARWSRSFTRIQRVAMQRAVNVTAHVRPGEANANQVMDDLRANALAELTKKYPGLSHAPGGQQQMQMESVDSLTSGFTMALVAMFGLLAVASRSYVQPLIVLLTIPLGALGVVAGHLLLGFDLSLTSMFGMVALAGVIVNDSRTRHRARGHHQHRLQPASLGAQDTDDPGAAPRIHGRHRSHVAVRGHRLRLRRTYPALLHASHGGQVARGRGRSAAADAIGAKDARRARGGGATLASLAQSLLSSGAERTRRRGNSMRVHHLNCISACPLGGLLMDGFSTASLRARLATHCLLIETDRSLVLVDTGYGLRDVADPRSRLAALFLALNRPELREEMTAIRQIERLGFDPRDVRHIVLSHLDFDHAGGLDDFPHATVHMLADELTTASQRKSTLDKLRYRPAQWSTRAMWRTYAPSNGASFRGFAAVRELAGLPPELLLVPLIGHTLGHAGVVVERTEGTLFYAADAYFYHGEMDPKRPRCTPGLRAYQTLMEKDRAQRLGNQARLRALVRDDADGLRVFCAHDVREFEALSGRGLSQPAPSVRSAGTPRDEGDRGIPDQVR